LIVTAALPTAGAAVMGRGSIVGVTCPATAYAAAGAASNRADGRPYKVRTDARLSQRGELTGRLLRVERGGDAALEVELPAESSVAERVGDVLTYTRSGGGRGSEVHLFNVVTGCDTTVARPSEIVRSAILDSNGEAVYVHSVARTGRRDAGVERHDLRTGSVSLVVPALEPQSALGPIHGTQLMWSLTGTDLAVQSCGFARCLTRILDVSTAELTTVDAPGQGALIAVSNDSLITFGTCLGLPCSVYAFERETGTQTLVAQDALGAAISDPPDRGPVLTISTAEGFVEVIL
jgi:hypothetical protein